ncbi:MAG: hypothetical protein NZ570_02575 [Candidatus Caldarchaeum sp.]|nr:hypothetical protein [Candidatus Caldarchaeum sp.]MDW8359350.1 hypothetical protein [Candidatus Caldarchaeum sp.]
MAVVLSAKIFELKQQASLEEVAEKLKDLRVSEVQRHGEKDFELATDVSELDLKKDTLFCTFSKDKVVYINQRGGLSPVAATVKATIFFQRRNNKTYLTVVQNKHFANYVASFLSHQLFLNYRSIVEARIPPENLQRHHEANPEATKVIFFDSLDYPGVDKVALYGKSLISTGKYEEYLAHGKIWYLVFSVKGSNAVLGVTRNCVVVSFSKMSEGQFIQYVLENVFPLLG